MVANRGKKLWLNHVLLLLAALASICLATAFFSETRFTVKAFEFTAALVPFQRGETVIVFPPFGKLRAATHWGPFLLKVTLNTVDLEMLSSSLQEIPDLPSFWQTEIREQLLYFFIRQALISFFCGAALLLIINLRSRRPWSQIIREALKAGLLTMLLLVLLLGATVLYPYQVNSFANPRFEGALAAAPWIVDLGEQLLGTVTTLAEQLEVVAVNLEEISNRLEQLRPPPESGQIRVLHISDIHNNPAAFDLIEKVAEIFQIDLIIDTGDLTDYGSNLETEVAARLASLPQPYLFLPGNHDTTQSIELLRREGAVIIGTEPVAIGGLRIAGLPDPAASNSTAEVAPRSTLREEASRAMELLSKEESPDIFAVHNPLMAEPFRGELPLILSGHTHKAVLNFDEESGSILINAGTTGAAGLRGLLAPRENPYSMVVLYFNTASGKRPWLSCADLIVIEQLQDSFTLQRYYNHLPERPATGTISLKEDLED